MAAGQSFNPCCGGIPLRIRRQCAHRGRAQDHVSILVVVEYLWESRGFWLRLPGRHFRVSILVVVEYLWESLAKSQRTRHQACFNPCCGGIPLRINEKSWTPQPRYSSFNPCCGGIPLRIRNEFNQRIRIIEVSILVVVEYLWEWIGLMRSWTGQTRFQSLLWWNTSENGKYQRQGRACLTRVSILVVVDYLWEWPRTLPRQCESGGFNPCCGGIPLRIETLERYQKQRLIVSILVVVEYLWE